MLYNQLRSFHAVAREGSAVKASRVLNVSQPTITTQIKELEAHFGVELFHRKGRRLELSRLGERLLVRTQSFFDAEGSVRELLESAGRLTDGHLRVGASGPYRTMRILKLFREQYPHIAVSVDLGNTREVIDNLHNLKTDVAIVSEVECGPEVEVISLRRQRVIALVPSDHVLATKSVICLAELAGQDMVTREEESVTRQTFEKALASKQVVPVNALEVGSREAVWEAVAEGHGIGIVSELSLRSDDRVVPMAFDDCEIYTETHVICLKERQHSLLIRAFLNVIGMCDFSSVDEIAAE